jgi:hypothetical protein
MDYVGQWPQVTVYDLEDNKLVAQLDIPTLSINFLQSDRFWPAPMVLGTLQGVAKMLRIFDVTVIEIFK